MHKSTASTKKPIPTHPRTGKPKLGTKPLTAPIIAAMRPGEELADPKAPGLRVRCGEAARVFFYRYRDKAGALRQIKLGEFGPLTLSGARDALNEERANLTRGGDPQAEKRQGRQRAKTEREEAVSLKKSTCAAIVEHYLIEIERNRKFKGAKETRRMLEHAIADARDTPADTVTRAQAADIIAAIAKTAPRVAAMTRQELRACWEYALGSGRISIGNPFAGKNVGGKIKSNKRKVTLDPAETGALLRWLREPATYSRTVADALELTLRTGLRSGEVCAIHGDELREIDGVLWLEIPGARMKQGDAHSVPLVGRAREIVIERAPEGGGFLFPSRRGGPISQKVLGLEVYARSGRSKLQTFKGRKVCPVVVPRKWPGQAWTPHDLRRTARTLLGDLGCPFEVGEAILAHALPGVAGTYNRSAYVPQKIEWLARLNEYLDQLKATKNLVALGRKRATA